MYTSLITTADKVTLQEDGSMFLDVAFEIRNEGGEVVDTKRLAFPLDADSDSIVAEIQNYTANYAAEVENKDKNAERDAEYAVADATIETIVGVEVNGEYVAPVEEVKEEKKEEVTEEIINQ